MLTLKHIIKVARLIDQCGEPTPGYLVDGTANLESHANQSPKSVLEAHLTSGEQAGAVPRLRVTSVVDDLTGDVRIGKI